MANIKMTELGRDFGMKNKEMLQVLAACGIAKKSGSLDGGELDAFFEYLTRENQIENLDDYLDGKATLLSDRPKEVKSAPAQQAEAAAPAQAETAEAEKPVQAEAATPAEKAAPKTEKPAAGEQESPVKAQPAVEKPAAEKPAAAEKPSPAAKPAGEKPAPSASRPAARPAPAQGAKSAPVAQAKPAAPAQPAAAKPAAPTGAPGLHLRPLDKPKTLPGNPGLHLRPVDKPKTLPAEKRPARPVVTERPAAPATARTDAQKSLPRGISGKSLSNRPAQAAAPEKPKKPQEKKQKQAFKTILPMTGAPLGEGGEAVVAKAPKTRVVDTRTTDVDLSRYDERSDRIATTAPEMNGGKQKLRKQDNRGGRSQKDKDRFQQEKQRRAEEERARNKQLEITLPEEITVGELATRLKKTSAEVIKKLMLMGVLANVNQTVDYETAYLVADEFGAKVTKEVVVTIEEKLFEPEEDKAEDLEERSPVVCVMGHVDHGKTSLLDYIRKSHVTAGEDGGITQAIGAYRVNCHGKEITFLDTPGHEAFTAMRARGAKATDIAILVVAADDGIMPQTIEAINHAKAAGVEIIVAINKMDKPHANPDQVKQQLTQYDLVPEEWGGDVICVPVSAVTGQGVDQLLESVLMVAELKEYKANPNRRAKGVVIESRLDKGRGPVATVLVQNGTLHVGDTVIAGSAVGRVRAMHNERKTAMKTAGPSVPAEIEGLDSVPTAGDEFQAVADEKMARTLAEQRRENARQESLGSAAKASLDDLFAMVNDGFKTLNIVVKADVDGSVEAVKAALLKLSNEEVRVNVIHAAVGGITESDVMLAAASNAIIVGFSVRPDKNALDSAARQKVEIRTYRIIYECIEEIEAAMKGMLAPKFKEELLGHAEVRQTIHVSSVGTVAGSYVLDGKITRTASIRVVRDGIVVAEDKIKSLRRFKDDVKEVATGYECGITLEKFNDIKEGDVMEAFEMVQIAQ